MSGLTRILTWSVALIMILWIAVSFWRPSTDQNLSQSQDILATHPLNDQVFVDRALQLTDRSAASLEQREALLSEAIRRNPRNRRALQELLIQSAQQGDTETLLSSIDHLYRLDRSRQSALIDVLISLVVSTDSSIDILTAALSENPLWGEPFLQKLLSVHPRRRLQELEPMVTAFLSAEMRLDAPERASLVGELYVDRLIEIGRFDLAHSVWWQVYDPYFTRAANVLNVNADFDKRRLAPPFDWDLIGGPNYSTSIRGNGRLHVNFFAPNGATVLRQLISLKNIDAVQLSLENPIVSRSRAAKYEWRLGCLSSGRDIGRYIVDNDAKDESPVFPAEQCELAELSLFVDRDETAGRSSLRVDGVRLMKVRGGEIRPVGDDPS